MLIGAAAAGLASASSATGQAITTIGSNAAQACYEAAREHRTGPTALSNCDQAFEEPLSAPDVVATHVNRGILRALRDDYSGALLDYDKAIALNPKEAEAYLNKGLLLLRITGRGRDAILMLDAAIANRTSRPALAYFARAVAHEAVGKALAAYKDYRQAAVLDPNWELPMRELRRFKRKS
jgi:tetratricopeptide (TPR) repeat protein